MLKFTTFSPQDVIIGKPRLPAGAGEADDLNIYPKECIERACTYSAPATCIMDWSLNDEEMMCIRQPLGEIPIMVMVSFQSSGVSV